MLRNSYFRVALFSLMLVGAVALAGSIKVWSAGDTLSSSDLNANFSHIHNNMVGGHGARLVNADVSTTANIAYTKIQNGRGIARASASMPAAACAAGTCTVAESLNITSIAWSSTGVYLVTLSYTATDNDFIVLASAGSKAATTANVTLCRGVATSTTTATISCFDPRTNTAADSQFSFAIFDSD